MGAEATEPKPIVDPTLKEYEATDTQAKYVDAVNQHGGVKPAARALGVRPNAITDSIGCLKRKAARLGYAPGHWDSGTAPGYRMGKVTVQRGPDGVERVWERQHPEAKKILQEITELAAHVLEDVRGLSPIPTAPAHPADDLMATYWFGDPHFGLGSSREDGGEDTSIEEADRLTRAGIDALASRVPACRRAILGFIGDNMHANDGSALTPAHRNPLDTDVRGFGAAFLSVSRAICYAVMRALERHDEVEVWVLPGNHDPDAAFAVAVAVSMFFDNNDRVKVPLTREYLWWTRFGKNLVAACHGDKIKPADIHGVLSNDCQDVWHLCDFRYVWQGHIHHDTVTEYQKTRIESLRTLAKSDAWHRGKGYRSMRDTRAVVLHKDFGEVERHTCSVAMLAPAPVAEPSNKLGLFAA